VCSIDDPRQAGKVEHDLVEMLVVAVSAVLSGADTFVEIEAWATEKLDWLRNYLELKHGWPPRPPGIGANDEAVDTDVLKIGVSGQN
jgi:hypothetical protein